MAFYKQDIVDVDLNTGNIFRSFMNHSIGFKDDDANRFGIRAFRDGEPVDLTGVSCQAVFMAPNGNNIALTSYGTVSGNVAYVTLPQACYDYEGQFCLAIKLVGGGVTGTVRIVDGTVTRTGASGTVAPTASVPTYQEILSVYDDMVAATSAANLAIAEEFDASKNYPASKNVINDGALYILPNGHTAGTTWANTTKVASNLGDQVSELKSALGNTNDDVDLVVEQTGQTVISKTGDGFINLNVNIDSEVTTTPVEPVNYDWEYAIVPCEQGDVFIINAIGGVTTRPWAFLRSDYTLINRKAPNTASVDEEVTAPDDSAYLVIDRKKTDRKSISGESIISKTNEIENEMKNIDSMLTTTISIGADTSGYTSKLNRGAVYLFLNSPIPKGAYLDEIQINSTGNVSTATKIYLCYKHETKYDIFKTYTLNSLVAGKNIIKIGEIIPKQGFIALDVTAHTSNCIRYNRVSEITDGSGLGYASFGTTSNPYVIVDSQLNTENATSTNQRDITFGLVKYTVKKTSKAGKRWVVLGDSISVNDDKRTYVSYYEFACEKLGAWDQSYAVAGMAYTVGSTNKIIGQINNIQGKCDIITIFAGTNDYGLSNTPLGTIASAEDDTTVAGAIKTALRRLITRFPTAHVGVFTPIPRAELVDGTYVTCRDMVNEAGYTLKQLTDLIIECCEQFNIPCFNWYDSSNLRPWNDDNNLEYFKCNAGESGTTTYNKDGLHPNLKGHRMMGEQCYRFVDSL